MQAWEAAANAARELAATAEGLVFDEPVSLVYNPLVYAWAAHAAYLERWARPCRVLFLGMNPGPFGMAQTGVPFGEVAAVRDWLGIALPVGRPPREHPKRPVAGFACAKSEVSGRRLWGLFRQRFGTPEAFFAGHFVANYCPLVFMSASGANVTPDKLGKNTVPLYAACDRHLAALAAALQVTWVVGVGAFAANRAREALAQTAVRVGQVLHPSPASPAANKDWAGTAARQLAALGIWEA